MSLLNTKPRYFPTAEATESGWINPVTKELLVSVGGLKSKLEAEKEELMSKYSAKALSERILPEIAPFETVVKVEETPVKIEEKEIVMDEIKPVKVRKEYTKKVKVITEETTKDVPVGKQLIGEVVEYNLDKPVIGE